MQVHSNGNPGIPGFDRISFRTIDDASQLPDLHFQGGVLEDGDIYLSIIPQQLVRITYNGQTRLLLISLSEDDCDDNIRTLESFEKQNIELKPDRFEIFAQSGHLSMEKLLAALNEGKGRAEAGCDLLYHFQAPETSKPLSLKGILKIVEISPEDDAYPLVFNLPKKVRSCAAWWCHSHWHWEFPYPQTRWTECHGKCLPSKDCRCGRGRGGKICMGTWTSCNCR